MDRAKKFCSSVFGWAILDYLLPDSTKLTRITTTSVDEKTHVPIWALRLCDRYWGQCDGLVSEFLIQLFVAADSPKTSTPGVEKAPCCSGLEAVRRG